MLHIIYIYIIYIGLQQFFIYTCLCYDLLMAQKNSIHQRSPAEVYRDKILRAYPEWVEWPRKLRRIFVCLPSYGVGDTAVESMCEEFTWDFEKTNKLIAKTKTFVKAVNDYVSNNYSYRSVETGKNSTMSVKWSNLQKIYMMESGISSYIKAESGKQSTAENKLLERSGLLDIDPVVNPSDSVGNDSKPANTVNLSGESSLFNLQTSLNGK